MSEKVIVSFASKGREDYNASQLRLIKSCISSGWDGSYLIRSYDGYCDNYLGVDIKLGSYPITKKYGLCNNHAEVPWGFKPNIIQEAIESGYKQIVWCDSTIRMIKDIAPLLELAKERGVVAFDNLGHELKNWISDVALEHLHITEKELIENNIKQIMACCIIFDVSTMKGASIFEEWMELSRDGVSFQNGYISNRQGFVASRHDQACLSGILWKYKVPLEPYGKLVYPPHDKSGEYGNDIYFINKGVN